MSSARARGRRPTAASTRASAARVVERVLSSRVPADLALAEAGCRLPPRDRRLLAELVYGVLRWRRRLDHVLAIAADRPTDRIDPGLLTLLRVAAVQLLALDRIPAHAAVSEAVDQAQSFGSRGSGGFVNAVLRRIARTPSFESFPVELADPVRRLALESSHPERMVERWWRRFGAARTRAIVAANNGERSLHLLAFSDRGGRDRLREELAAEGVICALSRRSRLGLIVESGRALDTASFRSGAFYVQDASSQAVALVPWPRPAERILDVAAAPGGKGFALLAAEPSIELVSADLSLSRLLRLDENRRRLDRVDSAGAGVVTDATKSAWKPVFDRVLVDAACSGTGTLRRHPELRWRFAEADLARLAAGSLQQLLGAARGVVAGGLLVFITCSIEEEENEEVVTRFLSLEPKFAPASFAPDEAPEFDDGDAATGRWSAHPGNDGDGFTLHLLRRMR